MTRQHRRGFKVLRISFDLSLVVALYFGALALLTQVSNPWGIPVHWNGDYLRLASFVALCWLAAFIMGGSYHRSLRFGFFEAVWDGLRVTALMLFFFSVVIFAFKLQFLSRRFFFIYTGLGACLLILTRLGEERALRVLRRLGFNNLSLLLVGEGEGLRLLAAELTGHPEWGYRVVGMLTPRKGAPTGFRVLGDAKALEKTIREKVVDEIFLSLPASKHALAAKLLREAALAGVVVREVLDPARWSWHPQLEQIGAAPTLTLAPLRPAPYARLAKGLFDRLAALSILLLLSPLLLLVSLGILLSMGWPVFFVQKRLGLGGRVFPMFKFRSMVQDARQQQEGLKAQNVMGGPVFKLKNDPRVTRLGAFLRRSSLDELPQLLNVLRGELSLVGPRPLPTYEARKVPDWAWRRYSVKPGITCTWQVSGRSSISFEQWMRMDLEYIDRWSLSRDLRILLATLPAVLLRRGAY